MVFSRFYAGVALRVAWLVVTLAALTWTVVYTHWYVTIALLASIALMEVVLLIRFASRLGQEVTRFLSAVAFGSRRHRSDQPFGRWATAAWLSRTG